jgi:hypothetical protein
VRESGGRCADRWRCCWGDPVEPRNRRDLERASGGFAAALGFGGCGDSECRSLVLANFLARRSDDDDDEANADGADEDDDDEDEDEDDDDDDDDVATDPLPAVLSSLLRRCEWCWCTMSENDTVLRIIDRAEGVAFTPTSTAELSALSSSLSPSLPLPVPLPLRYGCHLLGTSVSRDGICTLRLCRITAVTMSGSLRLVAATDRPSTSTVMSALPSRWSRRTSLSRANDDRSPRRTSSTHRSSRSRSLRCTSDRTAVVRCSSAAPVAEATLTIDGALQYNFYVSVWCE